MSETNSAATTLELLSQMMNELARALKTMDPENLKGAPSLEALSALIELRI